MIDTSIINLIIKDLENSIGNYRVNGKTCDGAKWPEGNHFYIVDDLIEQKTYHIPVDDVDNELFDSSINRSWGGYREGAGRPSTGRKRKFYYVTDQEDAEIKKLLQQLREG